MSERIRHLADQTQPMSMSGRTDEPETVSVVERMLASLPRERSGLEQAAVASAISACQDCAHAATACADACLGEEMVEELTGCVRALLNVADIAAATARVLSRTTTDPGLTRALLTACWSACRYAREQCQEHLSIHHHCGICARACRRTEQACRDLLDTTP